MTSIFLSGTLKRDKADEPWKEWRGVWAYGDLKDLKDDEIDKLSKVENLDEANRERGPLPFFFEVRTIILAWTIAIYAFSLSHFLCRLFQRRSKKNLLIMLRK